mgnify:CR=1 FL=1
MTPCPHGPRLERLADEMDSLVRSRQDLRGLLGAEALIARTESLATEARQAARECEMSNSREESGR